MSSSAAVQSIETVTFPCEEWFVTRTPQGELVGIKPIAATWTLLAAEDRLRFAQRGMDVKAMFACPRCSQIGVISESFSPPLELGDTKPLSELHCRKCEFGCRIILKDWDKRKLYCACYHTHDGTAHKQYLHAENEGEATKFFWAQHSLFDVLKVIGIAPVIGFFLENPKNDRVLLVD